jgi:hypothetical protein
MSLITFVVDAAANSVTSADALATLPTRAMTPTASRVESRVNLDVRVIGIGPPVDVLPYIRKNIAMRQGSGVFV